MQAETNTLQNIYRKKDLNISKHFQVPKKEQNPFMRWLAIVQDRVHEANKYTQWTADS